MARLTLLLALATAAHAFVPAPIAVSAKGRTAPRAQRTARTTRTPIYLCVIRPTRAWVRV